MKKFIIGLLAAAVICSTFIGVFATGEADLHSIKKQPGTIITVFTEEVEPH